MKINVKRLSNDAILPTYGTEYAAGLDLYAYLENITEIHAGQTKLIHTGIAIEIPEGYVGLIFPRSGLATKRNLSLANCVGVIDADYRGEIMVAIRNHSLPSEEFSTQYIENGERIAQMIIMPYTYASLNEVEELSETKRGEGGFGSTGSK